MKKFLLSIIIFYLSSINVFAHVKHYENYKNLEYDLFRNNKLIGFHKYDFVRDKDFLTIKSLVKFNINKLGVNLYNYYAESEEKYKNGVFYSFKSNTNQNKKLKYVNISLNNDKGELLIDGSSYKGPATLDTIIGTWWNHEIVKSKAQISAISGRIIEQNVTFIGKEKVTIGNKTFNALHFNFKSSDLTLPDSKKLNTDIWYEEETFLWIKAAFDKTGYWEYRIKNYK